MSGGTWTRLAWAEIANGGDHIHPNWAASVERAEAAGLVPSDLTGVQFTGGPKHELPRLVFSDRMVAPVGVFVWCPE